MSTQAISVTVLGSGRVADLLAQRIKSRLDFNLIAVLACNEQPKARSNCVVYLPSTQELGEAKGAERIIELLKAGFNVVSTLPPEALSNVDLIGACREGKSTFHGTGGFQTSLATRFNRAFASITRNIRDIELIEELDIEDVQAAGEQAQAVEGFYDAGLRILSDAVFGTARPEENISFSGALTRHEDQTQRARKGAAESNEQLVVQRSLGQHVIYDSLWTQRTGSSTPLQYRLNTTSSDAIGHVTIAFHQEGNVSPVDHLTCAGLLNAIRAVSESAPGILRHDLEINYVKTDDRLAH